MPAAKRAYTLEKNGAIGNKGFEIEKCQEPFCRAGGKMEVKHRSLLGIPFLGGLTPSVERRSLSLALDPVVALYSDRSGRNSSWHLYLPR